MDEEKHAKAWKSNLSESKLLHMYVNVQSLSPAQLCNPMDIKED